MSGAEFHFGLLSSGNVVMKSAKYRDRIAHQDNLPDFEMKAAGMWNNFPTVEIKTVCDYADGYKTKRWKQEMEGICFRYCSLFH